MSNISPFFEPETPTSITFVLLIADLLYFHSTSSGMNTIIFKSTFSFHSIPCLLSVRRVRSPSTTFPLPRIQALCFSQSISSAKVEHFQVNISLAFWSSSFIVEERNIASYNLCFSSTLLFFFPVSVRRKENSIFLSFPLHRLLSYRKATSQGITFPIPPVTRRYIQHFPHFFCIICRRGVEPQTTTVPVPPFPLPTHKNNLNAPHSTK